MNAEPPEIRNEAEARALMAAGLGKAELEFVASLTAPLYWILREDDRQYRVRNGSAFFLDAGHGPFGVTAHHVIEGWQRDRNDANIVALQLGFTLPIDLEGRNAIIAQHEALDIATFVITPEEIAFIEKTVLTGYQNGWPPAPPQQDRGVYYAGYPGTATIWLAPNEISFGLAAGGGVASSVSEMDISTMIERGRLIPLLGRGVPPEDYDFRGMSGGPMLYVIENKGLRSWALGGVIYEGPNPVPDPAEAIAGLEIIRARRAHFLLPDGTLDLGRWDDLASI